MATRENKYLENLIPKLYRRQTLDIMIFTYIDTARFLIPELTLDEAAEGFIKRYKIGVDLLNIDSIKQSYYRTQQLLVEAERKEKP
jgi:hypothetical protein